MNSKTTLRSFTLVTALSAAAMTLQITALPPVTDEAPAPGTVFVYTDRIIAVDRVDGRTYSLSAPEETFQNYAGLLLAPHSGYRYDTSELDKLLPLEVGRQTRFPIYTQDIYQLDTTIRVDAKEQLRLPAGAFDVYLIAIHQRPRPMSQVADTTIRSWYAPAFGLTVKQTQTGPFPADFELFAIDRPNEHTSKFDGTWSGTLTTTENLSGKCFTSPVPVSMRIENGRLAGLNIDNTTSDRKFYGSLSEQGDLRGAWISKKPNSYIVSLVDGAISGDTLSLRFANKSCVSQQVFKHN